MTERKPIDWESIERDYRAGLLSVREIASAHGCTHGAINKRAKRDGWDRDLKAKIQARADALVSKKAVSTQVSTIGVDTEREIVESNALAIVAVRMNHRTDIRAASTLVAGIMGDLIEDKELEIPKRASAMLSLSTALKNLVTLERQAYNLDEQQHEETYEDRLKRLMGD